jgi:hypothetical protein
MRPARLVAMCVLALVAAARSGAAMAFDALQPGDRAPDAVLARIKDVMHRFGVAVKANDFAPFHDSPILSAAFARQFSSDKMRAAFKPLLDSHADLTRLDALQPVLDGIAQVDALNQLIVSGRYPSAPATLFEMRFIREGDKLGLSYIDVHLVAAGAADDSGLRALLNDTGSGPGVALRADQLAAVRAAMHAFGVAVNRRDMGEFLKADIVSQFWRERQSAAQLDADYRNTIATRGDFTRLDGLTPVIPDAPSIDERGVLAIAGYYAAPDSRIGFKMGFVQEQGRWRLINFSIAPPKRAAAPQ